MIGFLIRIYRKLPGKPFYKILTKLYAKYLYSNRQKVVIAKRRGIKYELHLNEAIDSQIYHVGCFEPKIVSLINKYVKGGMTVLDIGANIGCHTLHLAKAVGKNGKVVAFEPISLVFSKLKRNIELNDFNNIICERIALSNENKGNQPVEFYASWSINTESVDANQINAIYKAPKIKDISEVITLDEYMKRKTIENIDFIKLDVDGHEYKVISGGTSSIKRFKPTMIIEFSIYSKEWDIIDFLTSLGYLFYSPGDTSRHLEKEAIIDNTTSSPGSFRVLCKHRNNVI